MRLVAPLTLLVALALLLGGCGGSDGVTGSDTATVSGDQAVQAKWEHSSDCRRPFDGASRWGCSIGNYRCQAVVVDRGWSVSCSRPGESVTFLVRP